MQCPLLVLKGVFASYHLANVTATCCLLQVKLLLILSLDNVMLNNGLTLCYRQLSAKSVNTQSFAFWDSFEVNILVCCHG